MTDLDHRSKTGMARREKMQLRLKQAAFQIVANEGIAALTVDAVIGAADVSRGTFYKYHARPDSLMAALGLEFSQDLVRYFDGMISRYDDPAERVATGMRAALHLARSYPAIGRFIARSGWPVIPDGHVFHQLVGRDLVAGIESGRFHPMPLSVAESLVIGLAIGGMHLLAEGPQEEDFPEAAAAAMLRALGIDTAAALLLVSRPYALPEMPQDSLLARATGQTET